MKNILLLLSILFFTLPSYSQRPIDKELNTVSVESPFEYTKTNITNGWNVSFTVDKRVDFVANVEGNGYIGILLDTETGTSTAVSDLRSVSLVKELLPGKYSVRFHTSVISAKFTLAAHKQMPEPIFIATSSYNRKKIATKEISNVNDLGINNSIIVTEYLDGLGRPAQTVYQGITPTKADLVTFQEYDDFGRKSNSWLPAVATGNNGAYIPLETFKTKVTATYNNTTYNAIADSKPYAFSVYEDSPLNRVVEQYGSGSDWHANKKSVKTAYKTNVAGDKILNCKLYKTSGANGNPTLSSAGNYTTGQLYVTEMRDENNNYSYEFKNKLNQVVLMRQINSNMNYDTYYVYNDFGNLCFVLPPRIDDEGIAQAKLNELAYQYKYDAHNRCIWKKIPGAEYICYVYDKADRLIFSQDGEQRAKGEWGFSIPNVLGNTVLTGICKNSLNYTSEPFSNVLVQATLPEGVSGAYRGYNLVGVTLSNAVIHSVNYYDNYTFKGYQSFPVHHFDTTKGVEFNQRYGDDANKIAAKGKLTGSVTAQLNPDNTVSYAYTTLYYDSHEQLIQTHSTNHMGGLESEFFAYNFVGDPIKKLHIHSASGKTTQTELYTYSYDHAGRLIDTKHKLGSGSEVLIASNTYDELGRLKTNKKGGNNNLQSTYGYNIRSWTKSISNPLFSQTLYYNESYSGSGKQYNGNITAMHWTVQGESTPRGYTFTYDNLSQLTTANYLANGSANTNFKVAYSYDKHGNMKTLLRYGKTSASTYNLIDNLTMTYIGNQLIKADDAVSTISIAESADFKDYNNTATEYVYNKNGAMYKDLNKGISDIQYNSLNLPRQIDIKSPVAEARNEYTYSSSGEKLKVVQKWNANYSTSPIIGSTVNSSSLGMAKTTDYVNNKIYENGVLKRILIDGGYIEGGVYYYYLNDHLGNNRVVASSNGAVIQKNHYYPFGMAFAENTVAEQGKQPYKYNGKESDQMHGLNMYDYLARFYEPAIGRFSTLDPHSESYYAISPYVYGANNPILNIDPDGRDYWSTNDRYQIQKFFDSLNSGASVHDLSGWNHLSDKDFISSLNQGNYTLNDKTGMLYMSVPFFDRGEVGVLGVSLPTDIKPGLTSEGFGYKGAFVYQYENHFWSWMGQIAYELSIASWFTDFNPVSYHDGITNWQLDYEGRIKGVRPIMGYPPGVGKGGRGSMQGGRAKMGQAKGNMPGNNRVQNRQVQDLVNKHNLSKDQQQRLHDMISGEGLGYHEIEQVIIDFIK